MWVLLGRVLPHRPRIAWIGLWFGLILACKSSKPADRGPPPPKRIEVVEAPAVGDIAAFVRDQQLTASREKQVVVVYVSASWCEPCRHFQKAVASGALDSEFGNLRLLKYDFDRDEVRLREAGYQSDMIPLFAVPDPSGRGGVKRITGSIKGPEAVDEIRPRLRQLLDE